MATEIIDQINTNSRTLLDLKVTDDTPDFYSLVRQFKPIAYRPYSRIRNDRLHPMFNWTIRYYAKTYPQPQRNAITMATLDAGRDSWTPGLIEKARLKALAQLNENASRSQFNLGVTMLEFGKTASMIATSASRIYHSIRMLKKGRLGSAIDALLLTRNNHLPELRRISSNKKLTIDQRLSNQWLELRYGWRPLLNDIYSSCEATARLLHEWPYDLVIRGAATAEFSKDNVAQIAVGARYFRPHYEAQSTVTQRYVRQIKVIPESYRTFNAMGLHNPYLVAWEVMPWSFVIDWFLPIGDYLAAAATPALPGSVGGCDSTRIKGFRQKTSNGVFHYDAPNYWYVENAVDLIETDTYTRSVGGDWPTASFPTISNAKWFPGRALDAISLLNSLRNGNTKDVFLKQRT